MEKNIKINTALTEEEIIQKIVQGERSLFEILIRRYNPALYKVCRSYGFNHHDAEDLMQEAYLTAYLQLSGFQHRASFKTWITKILIHKCLYKLNYGHYKREQPDSENLNIHTEPMHQAANKTDVENAIIRREFSRVLEHHLEQLPVMYKTVFILREVEGFSVAETAELLNTTPVNVKVRLNRAKTMLQKKLEQFYSAAEIFEFNRIYCDGIVKKVFEKLNTLT